MVDEYKPLLRNPRFLYLWTSQILSQVTINIINFVFLVRLFEKTGSSIATSFLWIAYALPSILVGPVAAAMVDFKNKRNILVIANLMQSLTILLFAVSANDSVFLLYGVVIIYSFLNQFYVPAEMSALPALVNKNYYAFANSLFFITQQASLILGFGIAGPLKSYIGFNNTLLVCSALLFAAFVSVFFLPPLRPKQQLSEKFETAFLEFFGKIFEGYRFIKEDRVVLAPFLLLMGMQVALTTVITNVPAITEQIFNIGLNHAGILLVVPGGIGASMGAVIIPKLLRRKERKKKIIEVSLFISVMALFVLVFLLQQLRNEYRLIISTVTTGVMGFGFIGILIPSQTFLQEKTPGGLRGRVFGNYWFMVMIATVFPVILSGAISEILGARFLLFILGLILFSILVFIKNKGEDFLNYR